MWIIPQNYQPSSVSALAMVASSEDLSLPDLHIEQSLMWRSKPSPLRTWSQRWKRDSWFRHLSGRILKPCQHTAFETELMSSLAAIPANRLAPLGFVRGPKTPDTSGHLLGDTSRQLDLFDASSRTSKDTSALDCETSLQTWKALVTQRRGEYSARLKSARLTNGSECTSWPTPAARDWKDTPGMASKAVNKDGSTRNRTDQLARAIYNSGQSESAGQLNPTWVEWLMGLPLGWTDLGSWVTE